MKRIISIFLAITMLFSITTGLDLTVHAAELSGTCGDNITWEIDAETGVLTISGTGEMTDYGTSVATVSPFYHNDYIKTAVIGEGITSIGNSAFFYCTTLTNVTLPSTLEVIGTGAFRYCTKLVEINIPDSVTTIENNAFQNCESLTSITIPDSVEDVQYQAFWNCYKLSSVELGNGITTISEGMFTGCKNLAQITIPNNVKTIKGYAFDDCYKLQNIDLPNNLESIGTYAFSDCRSFTEIDIPDSVKTIGAYCFDYCNLLVTIDLPEGFTYIPEGMFYNCTSLKFDTPESITEFGMHCFVNCKSLTEFYIPNGVTEISYNMFAYCTGLTSISIPKNITYIGQRAFDACDNLTEIKIYNPNCELYDKYDYYPKKAIIYGYSNSTAEAYATKYNRTFIPLDSSIITVVEPDLGEIEGLEYGENRVVWDEEITLKATALEGAKFEGWKVNGRLISLDRIYTDVCKNNMTIEAVFSEINSDEKITVTFLDKWGNLVANYNGTVDEVQAMLRQSIPTTSDIVGYTFTGWNMTDEEIKNINCSTTVWAKYKKAQIGYTVDTNAQLNLPAGVTNGNIPYDTEVTVFDEKATAWKIGDCTVAYGNSYSFFVGANVTVTAVYESITATPTVTMLKVTNGGDKKFQFFATRSIPDGYKLVKAGFVFGRDMTDDELVLSNVGKKAQSGFTVKVGYCSLYGANQYALNYGVSAGSACAKAFATYRNLADNTIHTIYSEFIKAE